jgi:tetratricopeptide (TPR) repeat protein
MQRVNSNIFINSTIKKANDLIKSGNYKKSLALLKNVLKVQPTNRDATFLMSVCALKTGNLVTCLKLIEKLLKLYPNFTPAIFNRGVARYQNNSFEQAISDFNYLLSLDENYADALIFRALARIKIGEKKRALQDLEMALDIRPNDNTASINRVLLLTDLGENDAALAALESIEVTRHSIIDISMTHGVVLANLGKHDLALELFNKVLKERPNHIEATWRGCEAYINLGLFQKAKEGLESALKYDPKNERINTLLGQTLHKLGHNDQALTKFSEVLLVNPNNKHALTNRGILYRELGQFEFALNDFNACLALNNIDSSDLVTSYINRSSTYKNLHDFDKAIEDVEKALQLNRDIPDARWNLGLLLLLKDDYMNGWDFYESRWDLKPPNNFERIPLDGLVLWTGEKGKNLVVWQEQGIGDQMLFSSMFIELAVDCENLTIICDKRLIPVFERSFDPKITFVDDPHSINTKFFDYQLPMGSLGRFYRYDKIAFSKQKRNYLKPSEKRRSFFKKKLDFPGKKLIGVSWKSSNSSNEKSKSIALAQIVGALTGDDVVFVNLQYGNVSDEILSLNIKNFLIFEEIDKTEQIDDLFALTAACDEVVTIANVTAHIAGSLGVKTKVLVNTSVGWRWHEKAKVSAWHASCEIYRCDKNGGWDDALEQLKS